MMKHSIEKLYHLVGKQLPPSDWFMIDQRRVNQFAAVSLDEDAWTHTDPVRAAAFGGTTVQGLLLLTLVPYLIRPHLALPEGCTNGLNQGFDRLRFTNVVRVGQRVRVRATISNFCQYRENWWRKTLAITVDIENDSKAALIADWIVVYM
jgi:acyl dehydratase